MKRNGFTLVEILLVTFLAGVIFVSAIGPMIYMSNRLTAVVREYGANVKVRAVFNAMFSDFRLASDNFTQIRLVDKKIISGADDDTLIIWSLAPVRRNGQLSTVIYKVLRGNEGVEAGLYRWELTRVQLSAIQPEDLKAQDARLVLKGVSALDLSAITGQTVSNVMSGRLPDAIRITLTRDEKIYTHEDSLPTKISS